MNCKTCGTPLLLKSTKATAERLKKQYYYTKYYFCPSCQKIYLDNQFKVVNDNFGLFTKKSNLTSPSEVEIWTDGACSNNGRGNAKAAWAFISGEYEEAGRVDGKQTNNRGEALAIYHALKWASEKGFKTITIHTDSQITLHGVMKHPDNVKENRDIFQKIHHIVTHHKLQVEYQKVLGHSGDPNNEKADILAVRLTLQ
jgi:ribonuclease HI